VVTPAGVVGVPLVMTIKTGETLTFVGTERVVARLTAGPIGVVSIHGSTVLALRPGSTLVSAVGIDYCADQISKAETCGLLNVVVHS
jgi:hypothetical protein